MATEQVREEMEGRIAEKEGRIAEMEGRIADLEAEVKKLGAEAEQAKEGERAAEKRATDAEKRATYAQSELNRVRNAPLSNASAQRQADDAALQAGEVLPTGEDVPGTCSLDKLHTPYP
mmetsp:Transcript_1473/g.4260  ORF Transcript_1473/g.4260 Transcript_1473/m.4260 type:complete len:119 (-) Transcript_1473:264-620(-)